MFKLRSIFKRICFTLAVILAFTGIGSSFTFAQEVLMESPKIEVISSDEGVIIYEKVMDSKLGEMLKIKNLSTNEEHIVYKDDSTVYLKNDKEILEVAKIEKANSSTYSSNITINSDWIDFGPDRFDFDLEGITAITVVTGIIAFALGGPALLIKAALSSLGAGAIYNGIYAIKWGKYRYVGSGVQGEYSSQLYQPNGRTLGSLIKWKGTR